MEINKNNYEAYLLDLWEGNLSAEDQLLLSHFLEKHPELDQGDALNLLVDISTSEDNHVFDKASIYFDQISLENYEYFFVAYSEGDLSKEEMAEVNAFLIENPALNQKFIQFKKSKLHPETILYRHKEKLVLGKTSILLNPNRKWIISAVAASILVLLWISFPFQNDADKITLTSTGKKDLNENIFDTLVDVIEKQETNPNVPEDKESANRIAVQPRFYPSNKEKKFIQHPNVENFNPLTPSEKENSGLFPHEERIAKLETVTKDLNTIASNDALENLENYPISDHSPSKKEIPTLRDLTVAFLQRKNVLNKEQKADLKGIVNTTLAKVNANNEPVFASTEESNMKTTLFQIGSLKVERKTIK